ncbi:hypothetical protein ACN9MZ_08185 [Pseudoduganella sp. S-14]|uniref:hypothetical protein n=1 Tax=Pseudoduganella sp. S-14 TaxID=3404065 RepID=UPI003CF7F572
MERDKKMTGLKKVWLILAFGMAAGASYTALAAPDPRTCYDLIVKCNGGDKNACFYGKRIGCDM